jgi:HAD superfamily hydrolase (TIGR01509 family)
LASFHKALRDTLGIDVSDEFIERRIGVGAADTFREILKEKAISYDDALVGRLLKVKIQVQIALAREVKLFPGALELLEVLNGKVKVALASMNNRKVIDHMLTELKVKDCFSAVLTGDEVERSKPNPEIFLKSALKVGSSSERCVVVEDSIFGVKAAKAAKMGCVAVLTGVYSREELSEAKPDLVVESLSEKDAVLSFIFH